MSNLFKSTIIICILSLPYSAYSDLNQDNVPKVLELNAEDEYLTRLVTAISERAHYAQSSVNNESSIKILNEYIDRLDQNKMYFSQSDIIYFQRYKYKLDDALRDGQLRPIFDMFSTYRLRVQQRLDHAIKIISEINDFESDDEYHFRNTKDKWKYDEIIINKEWQKKTTNDLLSLVIAGQDLETAKETLRKRYLRYIKRINEYNEQDVLNIFLNAYMKNLDPHSSYLNPSEAEEYEIQTSLSYQGIGARLQTNDDFVQIIDLIPGGPAFKDGTIKPLDKIIGVYDDDQIIDVIGWDVNEVVKLIRGPKGTVVTLKMLPSSQEGDAIPYEIALTRDEISLEEQAASSFIKEINEGGILYQVGVIKVPGFYQDYTARRRGEKDFKSTTSDVRRIVNEFKEIGIDGLVIDLRGNSGGMLDEASGLTGLFIDEGPVVQLKDMDDNIEIINDPLPGTIYDGPISVVIDRFSASASEIFAAAIQDYSRGLVIGQKSFGKGSVQNLYPLDRYARYKSEKGFGQLTLTIAKYYRVNGSGTQNKGVIPDIILPSFIDEALVGEENKDNTLPWDQILPLNYSKDSDLDDSKIIIANNYQLRKKDNLAIQYINDEIEYFEKESSIDLISLNYKKRLDRRNSRNDELEARRNKMLTELGYTNDYDFEDFRDETILNQVYSVMVDMILHKIHGTSPSLSKNLQEQT
jgi:carboxyl-terminal processing protease|tara:strand:+ start:927 stop:3008 length:2082 start_codon:yes stop_codon:yes gene_type:complete